MPSILLIEDDGNLRETIAAGLTHEGHDVIQAEDGESALRMIKEYPVDAVVTDIVMPNMDGLEVIKRLRAAIPNLAIVAMSGGPALNAPLYLKIAVAMGADRTIRKPFMLQEITEAVDEILKIRRTAPDKPPPN
ncbi:MAG TPA: response regulator [Opitutaceae bacterium]|jgi:DNA-binding response OmpR family regulator|nr:response regulator [Opitutaceae bacterium]